MWKNFCNITGRNKKNPIISKGIIDWTSNNNNNNDNNILNDIDEDLFSEDDSD